jgi:hypothetical protein
LTFTQPVFFLAAGLVFFRVAVFLRTEAFFTVAFFLVVFRRTFFFEPNKSSCDMVIHLYWKIEKSAASPRLI